MVRLLLPSLSLFAAAALAKTVTYDFNITWVRVAPDGYERAAIGVNNAFPPPTIRASKGDTIVVNVQNSLGNESTSLHWHGIYQNGTSHMDGATGVGQCPIAPGHSFKYEFKVDQVGTYWYHSHHMGQVVDGLWGPLIIEDPNPPFMYDEEIIVTLHDWYHEEAPYLIHQYQSQAGEALDGLPPPSGGALINYSKHKKFHVKPNTVYMLRFICPSSYPGLAWVIEGHNQTTVEVDGTYVDTVDVNADNLLTRVAPGQRQSVLITTKNDTSANFAMWATMDVNMLFINKGIIPPPLDYDTNVTAYLVYDDEKELPDPPVFYTLGNANFWDDLDYTPLEKTPLLEPVDHRITLDIAAANISGISRFTANNLTYLPQDVPSLYSAISMGGENDNSSLYGQVNPIIVKQGDIVEIVINNNNSNLHPFHMHGHQFQVLDRPDPNYGRFNGTFREGYPTKTPVLRDTVMVQDESWAVIRFRADNPGVWAFHCHIEIHISSGLMATIIEAPDELLKQKIKLPQDHIDVCKAYPMPYEGNAAGHTGDDLFNTEGFDHSVALYDWGAIYPPSEGPTINGRSASQ